MAPRGLPFSISCTLMQSPWLVMTGRIAWALARAVVALAVTVRVPDVDDDGLAHPARTLRIETTCFSTSHQCGVPTTKRT